MEIRNLTSEHFEESMNLSQFAFQIELTEEEREARRPQFKPDERWGAFEGEKLMAQLTLLPLHVYIQRHKFAMGGIAGVATWPEYRRQGFVSKLLYHSLRTMREAGQTVSMLHPFDFGFYRKYGWEMLTEYRKYTIETFRLPARVQVPGTIERLINPNTELLSAIYELYAARYNGMLSRADNWWTERIYTRKKGQTAVYRSEDGQPQGYILYEVKERVMTVHELIAINETARRALWTFIANHDSMANEVTVIAPIDDDLTVLLDDPRVKQEIVPYFMARIVDNEAFAAHYPFVSTGHSHDVYIRVHDHAAEWNDGWFYLHVDKMGGGTMKPIAALPDTELVNAVECDIQTLTSMMLGYRRPARLHQLGKLTGSEQTVQCLEQLIPAANTFLYDFF
ncbi:GNAT family N-acetyltransferase [Paenibacillus xylaniclasticus]|uniref:GNAT family N-acetyltransferase n=1 Tax=Paenibacillus xylaniclasticus TaxID=588083 RepID=UPI001774F6F1|nr:MULTISPECIES: GNAT family N-acetyltransferase [Paenibacillus]GFN33378.1 acetyltransferase [Paenibacillus curdlanolyticus]